MEGVKAIGVCSSTKVVVRRWDPSVLYTLVAQRVALRSRGTRESACRQPYVSGCAHEGWRLGRRRTLCSAAVPTVAA